MCPVERAKQKKAARQWRTALRSINFLFAQPIAICQNLLDKE